jgi:predicted GNAT superfamily acetyltransferase
VKGAAIKNMTIRELTTPEEFDGCLDLQRDGFGWSDVELMPMRFFVVSRHIGGVVLGAFEGDTLVGFLSAIPGVREGVSYWHSHMLAVTRTRRDSGIGFQLKQAQKDRALKQGIRRIEWTFDPLASRNAYLNIEKLGVVVRRYYPGFYGGDSDRLIAEWQLDEPRPVVGDDVRRVAIPASLEAAQTERLRVREEFLANFKDGFFVAAFERHDENSSYVFIPEASREYHAD